MESTLQGLKVLFLEDSEIDFEIVYQKLIDDFKYTITLEKAQNEECFLHMIKYNQYDVILADYTLPGYNAVSALEQSQKICPDTPFICVSGTIGEDLAVEMLKQGAADYVIKDRLQRLPFAIRRAINTTLLEQQRKKAEQAFKERLAYELKRNEHLLNTIVQNTTELLYLNDCEGRVVFVNDAYSKAFGVAPKDVIGKNALELYHDEKVARTIEENDRKVIHTGEALVTEEMVQMPDGSMATFLVTKSPWRDGYGNIVGVVGVSHNITDRKRVEEVLKKSEEKALLLVEELEKADKNKNQFISVLSHELRNPLAVIVASLSLLKMTNNPEQILKSNEIVNRQVSHLTKLVDDLLDLTRINQNKIKLKKVNIELCEILKQALQDYESEYRGKRVRLSVNLSNEPVFLSADPVRILQCVGNLLQNALKFTPEAGEVVLSLETENSEAVISVRDNGMGISRDVLEHLFIPFTQADTSLDRQNNNGLGLGLSIAKGIAELHGGNIIAFSEGLGKGSLFTIRLPICVQAQESQNSAVMKIPSRIHKILLIEDNESLADVLCNMFDLMGYQAYVAYNGMEGITEAKKIRPDVIFCDIGLPGLSGYEVAKILKTDDNMKNTFLVALTGYAGESDAERARESGFEHHIAKPIDMSALEGILSEII